MNDIYETKDKQITPFLLIQPEIKFLGTHLEGLILYFKFTPFDKCQQLINDFACRKAPLVQAKDLLDAVETFRDMIFEMKEKRRNYGESQSHPDKSIGPKLSYGFRKAFIKNESILLEARFLLILLMTYKGKNPNCWPSLGELGKRMGRNRDTVRKYMKVLINKGYVVAKSRGIGRSLLYTPSYWKISAGRVADKDEEGRPTEILRHEPTETLGRRSINSGNKEKENNKNKKGIESLRNKLKELRLKK